MYTALETSDVSLPLHKKFYVYILFSYKDNGLYIGYTIDLRNRLVEHARGRVDATKLRRPLLLIHYEYFIDSVDAKAREKYLKSGYGREQLKNFVKRTLKILLKNI